MQLSSSLMMFEELQAVGYIVRYVSLFNTISVVKYGCKFLATIKTKYLKSLPNARNW